MQRWPPSCACGVLPGGPLQRVLHLTLAQWSTNWPSATAVRLSPSNVTTGGSPQSANVVFLPFTVTLVQSPLFAGTSYLMPGSPRVFVIQYMGCSQYSPFLNS